MKLVFLGSPSPATPTLRGLVDAGHEVLGVVTQPDKRRGRGSEMIATPVAQIARELGIPIWHSLEPIMDSGAELGVVVAYGKLIPQSLLDVVPMINVHFSLLPKWRGAAPVERALLAGDNETGVCIMGLEAGLDTGPIFAQASIPLDEKTSLELLDELADLGARLCVEVLSQSPLPAPSPQEGEATYASKLGPQDFILEPELSTELLIRVIRLGRAFTYINGQRVRIHGAVLGSEDLGIPGTVVFNSGLQLHAGDGSLAVTSLQSEGSRRLDSGDWWRGARLTEPIRWGSVTLNVG
jgi:methionyl-tRNA formyltransferase